MKTEKIKHAKHISPEQRIGRKYGHFTVIRFIEKKKCNYKFLVKCDCGKEVGRWMSCLVRPPGHCGCMRNPLHKHEYYHLWASLRSSGIIANPDPFPDFATFATYLSTLPRPAGFDFIMRIDRNLPWDIGNIAWCKRGHAQARFFEVAGITKSISEWAEVCGISRERMRQRLAKEPAASAILRYDGAKALIYGQR